MKPHPCSYLSDPNLGTSEHRAHGFMRHAIFMGDPAQALTFRPSYHFWPLISRNPGRFRSRSVMPDSLPLAHPEEKIGIQERNERRGDGIYLAQPTPVFSARSILQLTAPLRRSRFSLPLVSPSSSARAGGARLVVRRSDAERRPAAVTTATAYQPQRRTPALIPHRVGRSRMGPGGCAPSTPSGPRLRADRAVHRTAIADLGVPGDRSEDPVRRLGDARNLSVPANGAGRTPRKDGRRHWCK